MHRQSSRTGSTECGQASFACPLNTWFHGCQEEFAVQSSETRKKGGVGEGYPATSKGKTGGHHGTGHAMSVTQVRPEKSCAGAPASDLPDLQRTDKVISLQGKRRLLVAKTGHRDRLILMFNWAVLHDFMEWGRAVNKQNRQYPYEITLALMHWNKRGARGICADI